MDWENTGTGSINRTGGVLKRSVSFMLILVKENRTADQYIGNLCFRSSLYSDHSSSQDINRLIPSSISTHPRARKNG